MRWATSAVLVIPILLLASCEDILGVNTEEIPKRWAANLTFDNNSDALLCFSTSGSQGTLPGMCNEVKPGRVTEYEPTCAYGDDAGLVLMTVALVLQSDGDEIYSRRETCQFWEDAKTEFTISQEGGEFVVDDDLPGHTNSP